MNKTLQRVIKQARSGTIIAAAVVLTVSGTTAVLSPRASAAISPGDTSARASWNGMAQDMLQWLETHPDDGKYTSWTNAYTALLSAQYRGWNDSRTQTALSKVYAATNTDGGYGINFDWDAFQDGSVNSYSTSYTVSTADHVGPALLAGWKAGAVPASYVIGTVDSLLLTRIDATPNGECMAYSRTVADRPSTAGCVVNVSLGAAAYLQTVINSGILNGDTVRTDKATAIINRLKPLGLNTYNATTGGWSYMYKTNGQPVSANVQDWNHNAYTFESAITLYGASAMNAGITNYLRSPHYGDGGVGDGTVGRIRLQHFAMGTYPENAWRDAVYASTTITSRTEAVQLGLWSMRMGENATAATINWRQTASIGALSMEDSKRKIITGSSVPKNTVVVFRSVVKSSNGTPNVYQNVLLNAKPTGGATTTLQQKTTGSVGNIAFVATVTKNTCYSFVVKGQYTNTGSDKTVTRCVTVK